MQFSYLPVFFWARVFHETFIYNQSAIFENFLLGFLYMEFISLMNWNLKKLEFLLVYVP
jgi:hypothetical protein